MAETIPQSHVDLVDTNVYVTFVTMMPDGQPQASVIWTSWDGTHLLVNTVQGRQKAENMNANPKVTALAIDPTNPYRYVEIRGHVVEATTEGAVEHIDLLANRYRGVEKYFGGVAPAEQAGIQVRVIYKIEPVRVRAVG